MTETIRQAGAREERPDAGGVVRRGAAAERVKRRVEGHGEPTVCYAGSRPGEACERPSVMEVYGIPMCEVHGEEAAAGALEEIAYDLEQELQRPMNPYIRRLSPHIEAALKHGFESMSEEMANTGHGQRNGDLLRAFPLDRDQTDVETLAYVEDYDDNRFDGREMPSDAWHHSRLLICRHMRLAFEEEADWLVELLEKERWEIAAQLAYALALEREAGCR